MKEIHDYSCADRETKMVEEVKDMEEYNSEDSNSSFVPPPMASMEDEEDEKNIESNYDQLLHDCNQEKGVGVELEVEEKA